MILQIISQWIDLIWLPIAFFVVHKDQRVWAIGFIIGCAVMLRMQVELMESTGYATGFLPFVDIPLLLRGMITYSCFYVGYLLMAYFSPGSHKHVMMAASISLFFGAACMTMLVMLL